MIKTDNLQIPKILKFTFKVLVSLLALFVVFRNLNLSDLGSTLAEFRIDCYVLALILNLFNQFLSSIRIFLLNKKKTDLWMLIKLTFIGNFFNLFLPTSFGGDFIKAYYLGKKNGDIKTGSIFLFDRVYGITGLGLVALLGGGLD